MKYILSVLLGFIIITKSTNNCNCAPIENWRSATEAEFQIVDLVFVGDVQRIDEEGSGYEIVVCEVFKGNLLPGERISGINPKTCNPVVDRKGQWLFFGEKSDQNRFKQNICGLTNHLMEPVRQLPPPPPPDSGIDYEEYKRTWKKEAKEIVSEQLQIVRKLAK